ncbi:MAG: ABC transporter ATP-binding protein [bacterium]|nr:ABC transporter ATP-binding protein [bacterium]
MIKVTAIVKNFIKGDIVTNVLKSIDLEVPEGQFLSIMGPSGAGKSTLLYQISLLDKPTSGSIIIDGIDVSHFKEAEATRFRLKNFGFVFQDSALIPEFTALENTLLPSLMLGDNYAKAKHEAIKIFTSFGMLKQIDHLPSQLSGGEMQRVSVIRAIVRKPKILFADEPTASLDTARSHDLMSALLQLHQEGQTIIMVSHEEEFAKMAQRMIYIRDGRIEKDIILSK